MNIHDDRIIAELNYKLALSYEFLMQWKESLESLAETKKILETRIENLKVNRTLFLFFTFYNRTN